MSHLGTCLGAALHQEEVDRENVFKEPYKAHLGTHLETAVHQGEEDGEKGLYGGRRDCMEGERVNGEERMNEDR